VSTSSSSRVTISNLRRTFGEVIALDSFSLDIKPGELVTLLGPSGCGKTTALRMVAGLDVPDSGIIEINGAAINDLPPSNGNMGMVFQAYSLFPNMTAIENVEFGLRVRGIDKAKRRKRAEEMIELVDLGKQANRFPNQMSGGQQQRVALARALAIEPNVLLLDEPLSALDAKVRTHLRDQIRRVQQEVGITTLFVTHDQEEAISLANRIAVFDKGEIKQISTPQELYENPQNEFVADFIGEGNILTAEITNSGVSHPSLGNLKNTTDKVSGTKVKILLRPENIGLEKNPTGTGVIQDIVFAGSKKNVTVQLSTSEIIRVYADKALDLEVGSKVNILFNPADVRLF